ncbi:MAG: hypothetical protein ACXWZS_12635 [Gemmatirosa sp.]
MAEGREFACTACARTITAWDEGDPYYRDADGEKQYAYHPSPERARCTGVDSPRLCLACGAECTSDSAAPTTRCPACAARRLVDTWKLEGRACPWCSAGVFRSDPTHFRIS